MILEIKKYILKILNKNIYLKSCIVLLFIISCKYIDKPKNFLSEDQMADILLDMAIFDESPHISSDIKTEETYKHIFVSHNISIEDYTENYAYYISQKKIKYIISIAEKKLMTKDPEIQNYINKKTDGI